MQEKLRLSTAKYFISDWLQEEQDEHGQGKWEGKQKGKSDKRIKVFYLCVSMSFFL
jgi:hypothetical protein